MFAPSDKTQKQKDRVHKEYCKRRRNNQTLFNKIENMNFFRADKKQAVGKQDQKQKSAKVRKFSLNGSAETRYYFTHGKPSNTLTTACLNKTEANISLTTNLSINNIADSLKAHISPKPLKPVEPQMTQMGTKKEDQCGRVSCP